jgi:flavin-dependent dehydrogenase
VTDVRRTDVVVIGGGLAGAAVAIRLARLGREVLVLERSPRERWTACGVFTATAAGAWHDLGLDDEAMTALASPIPAFQLVAPGGARVPLTYGAAPGEAAAQGLDRPRLDVTLLALAATAGATICRGSQVVDVEIGPRGGAQAVMARGPDGAAMRIEAPVIIGADGIRSTVAARLGAVGRPAIGRRIALTYHLADRRDVDGRPRDGWMFVLRGGYCGVAPVPGGRVNVGIVLDTKVWRGRLRRDGATATAASIVRSLPIPDGAVSPFHGDQPLDQVAGVVPVAHAAARLSGDGWLLAGDAAGFLDPFTGEGIGRALATARLAAFAVDDALRGDRRAFRRYAAEVRSRYRARDWLSTLIQLFLDRPSLFDYAARRLATRQQARTTLGLVLAERLPASVALHPRYLGAVLRP